MSEPESIYGPSPLINAMVSWEDMQRFHEALIAKLVESFGVPMKMFGKDGE